MTQIDGSRSGSATAGSGAPVSEAWLRAFDAAVRAGSFTAAAAELGVGQPAVSHAVSRLEAAIGADLFERSRSGVEPTEVGSVLAEHVRAGFRELDRGVALVRERAGDPSVVTLSVSTSLAAHWLMPRLAEFKAAHPEVDLRCITNDSDRSVGRDGADLWIPLGAGPWPGLATRHFVDEEVFPVASPELAARLDADGTPLEAAPLLHLEERFRPRFDWARWFAETRPDQPEGRLAGERSNDYSLILHGAMAGQGVALGWRHIVDPLIAQGRLVAVGDDRVATGEPFVLVAEDEDASPAVTALREWLVAAMATGAATGAA